MDVNKLREILKTKYGGYTSDTDGLLLCYTDKQRDMVKEALNELERLQNEHDKLNKLIMTFQDLLREGHFEDALEETKKDGEAKENRYNNGIYDVLNLIEDWWLKNNES